jgi:hypothetical protein
VQQRPAIRINANFNSKPLVPGSFAVFALPSVAAAKRAYKWIR